MKRKRSVPFLNNKAPPKIARPENQREPMPSITERQPGSTRITKKNKMQTSQREQLHSVSVVNPERNKKGALNGLPKP